MRISDWSSDVCSSDLTSTDGVVIDERLTIRADASGPRSARMVLQNPRVDFAVFEVARGGILREGLGYERNDVAVVLNVAPAHLGLRGLDTIEHLADRRTVVLGTVVSVRVDFGGRRNIKKKK